ncbi:MAG: hypothetical protein KBF88_09370 [Polyangiaceae bacterium]|nr:hypothetical protein [Polyangiaceae bacterium]
MRLALASFVAFVVLGCGGGAPNIVPKSASGPSNEPLGACLTSGAEICFNATDDNCNGAIDEGCGATTGVLQFSIAWGASRADVDLNVMTPTGGRISASENTKVSGWSYDRDCPENASCYDQNTENISCTLPDPPAGVYLAEIRLSEMKGETGPIRVRFGARVGTRSFSSEVLLDGTEKRKLFRFTL